MFHCLTAGGHSVIKLQMPYSLLHTMAKGKGKEDAAPLGRTLHITEIS